jgi:hypothetical protein
MDSERRRWLEKLATACKKVLADLGADRRHAALAEDVEELLIRTNEELRREPRNQGRSGRRGRRD